MATRAKRETTRRGFIGAIGAAAAATALPDVAVAVGADGTLEGWQRAQLPGLRSAYFAELVRFAEELRPRFAAGELRGFADGDGEPLFQLQDLCEERFHLNVDRCGQEAYRNAYLIRSVSPSDGRTEDAQPIAGQAAGAVACDVIAVARARRWYSPSADEDPSLEETRWALELA